MSTIAIYLGQLLGLYLIVISIAMLIGKRRVVATLNEMMASGPWMLFSGMVATAVGLAIILARLDWGGGALAIAITVAGWVALIKGLALLVIAPETLAAAYRRVGLERYFYLWMGLVLILGLWIATAAFLS